MTESQATRETTAVVFALETVFREQASYVWHTLRRMGVRASDLEDATHDVFLVVHKLLPEYDPTRPIKPWLYGIASRVALRHRSKAVHRREQGGEDFEQAHDEGPSPESAVETNKRRAFIQHCLGRVHESRRDVLVLHDLDGVSMPDIVAALAIPLNTGYSRLRLARKEFQTAMRALEQEGGAP